MADKPKRIVVHIEDGVVQDIGCVPEGYEVEIRERDDNADTDHESYDKTHSAFRTVWNHLGETSHPHVEEK
jgi:hypothetical protein